MQWCGLGHLAQYLARGIRTGELAPHELASAPWSAFRISMLLVEDVAAAIDVAARGRILRAEPGRSGWRERGVSASGSDGEWRVRTIDERGVGACGYACGTGAVATAACLIAWGGLRRSVALRTASDRAC
jgi:hypothetical protein